MNIDDLFDKLEKKLEEYHLKATGKASSAISAEQRKKAYVLMKQLADHLGYTTDDMKAVLKQLYSEHGGDGKMSLSNCSKKQAHDFIDFILQQMIDNGMSFSPEDILFYEKTVRFVSFCVERSKCIVCGKDARKSNFNQRPFTLCETHIPEWSKDKRAFVEKYHFLDYFYGIGRT